jgi:enoyl-CoA hydratase/carnithine racemase
VNTLNALFAESLAGVLDRLEDERDDVAGVIMRSAKSSFLAGGDLNRLAAVQPADRADFLADLQLRKSRTRRLELLGRPVVAVLSGAALGGGLELALACHHRIAVDDPRVVMGLPEVTLGLLPGGGGIVRTVLGLGLDRALKLLLSGARLGVAAAVEVGLLDDTAADESAALDRARAWIRRNPVVHQPWDDPRAAGSVIPIRDVAATSFDDPARRKILDIARRVKSVPVEEALRIESEGLADLVVSDAAKATMQVVFFDTVRVRSRLGSKPADTARRPMIVFTRTTDVLAAALHTLAPRIRVVDLAAEPHLSAEVDAARADAGWVVLDVVDGGSRSGSTDVSLRIDRLGDGGLVLVHAAASELADVLPAFSRAGALPIAVRPGGLDLEVHNAIADPRALAGPLAGRLLDALEHVEDVDVVSVRVCGFPSWTGGAVRYGTELRPTGTSPPGGARG